MRKVGFAALNRYGGATTDSADFTDQVLNRRKQRHEDYGPFVAIHRTALYSLRYLPIGIEHVLHPERDRRAIQPGAPSTRTVLGSGDRQNVFLLAIGLLHIFTAVLGETSYLLLSHRRR